MRSPATIRRVPMALIAVVLMVAACTSSGDTDTTAAGGGPSTSAAAVTTTSDATGAPTTSASGVAENTASFRGVTADTIKVGITVPDFEALRDAGIDSYQGSNEVAFGAFIDRVNAAGGINGRMIEPVYASFSFIDPASQDAACVQLTEDEEVFIVLYGLLAENNLCLAETYDTMVMTDQFQTTTIRERAGDTLWIQLRAADDEQVRILGSVLAESGRLDDRTVGIVANGSLSNGVDGEILQGVLADQGIESTVLVTAAGLSDVIAQRAETEVFAERLQSEGVDFVFNLIGGGNAADIFAENGFTPETAFSSMSAGVDGTDDPSVIDGAVGVGVRPDDDYWNDPEFRAACVDPIVQAHPELAAEFEAIPTGAEQLDGTVSWLNPTRIACNQVMLLQLLGEIAGADLTNDSFRAALDQLGPVDLHGYGRASFRSDGKWDGLDEFFLQEFDAASGTIGVVGDPIVIDR